MKLNNITTNPAAGALLVDFDRDTKEDILELSMDRQKIVINQKMTSFHKIKWTQQTLIDVKKLKEMLVFPVAAPTVNEQLSFKISSFIVDDINYDMMPDLIIGIDVYSMQEGYNYTLIVKLNHDGKLNFSNYTLIDPECGKTCRFLLVDHAPYES